MKKTTLSLIVTITIILTFSGCTADKPASENYKKFVSTYKNDTRYFCDKNTGFFMKEYFYYKHQELPFLDVVNNDLKQPTRCGRVEINVNETSAGTQRED